MTPERSDRLRAVARDCFEAAIGAVDPGPIVEGDLRAHPIPGDGPVRIVAVGKAADAMTAAALRVLGDRVVGGVVIAPPGAGESPDLGPVERFVGGHPIPNEEGLEGSRAVLGLARSLGAADELLCLISGGGSALMTLPRSGLGLGDLRRTTDALLRAGAEIGELNAVRKHLETLKGGGLAREAAPARVTGLVLSDVIGDPLDVIASGPLSPDPTRWADVVGILEHYGVEAAVGPDVTGLVREGLEGRSDETPKAGDSCFGTVAVRIVGNNRRAVDAAAARAEHHGFRPLVLTTRLAGEAREVGRVLATVAREIRASGRPLAAPACLVAGGETTVTVRGAGRGGRNQEVALGAARELAGEDGVLVASIGTDGIDGPTDAAGALALGDTVGRARAAGLDPAAALADNDAHPFFDALGDLIRTGPTGTNVMDLALVLVDGGQGTKAHPGVAALSPARGERNLPRPAKQVGSGPRASRSTARPGDP